MWGDNSTTYGLGFNRTCMCHTATVPCRCMCHTATVPYLCTNPITSWSSVLLNSNNLLNYQRAPPNGFSQASNLVNPPFQVENGQETNDQMATNEPNSWLLSNPDNDQFFQMQTQGIQASLQPIVADVVPEATIGTTMDLPQQWPLDQFSFTSFNRGNLMIESVGNCSNSTTISSSGTQLLTSRDDLQKPTKFPPTSRQDRILRYLEKKKKRKYAMKIIYSSRKAFAKTRPRIRGRFARSSQTDEHDNMV